MYSTVALNNYIQRVVFLGNSRVITQRVSIYTTLDIYLKKVY